MKLEIKEIDGVPVTGIPDGSRTVIGVPGTYFSFYQMIMTRIAVAQIPLSDNYV